MGRATGEGADRPGAEPSRYVVGQLGCDGTSEFGAGGGCRRLRRRGREARQDGRDVRWDRRAEPEGRSFNRRLGKLIAERRTAAGLTQAELAQRIGLNARESMSNIETGDRMVRAWDLCQIAEVLGLGVADFTDAAYVRRAVEPSRALSLQSR